MFAEVGLNFRQERYVNELDDLTGEWWEDDEWYGAEEDSVNSVSAKCLRCGKTGHVERDCKTDLSRVECFRCGEKGHIGARCPKPKAKAKPLSQTQTPVARVAKLLMLWVQVGVMVKAKRVEAKVKVVKVVAAKAARKGKCTRLLRMLRARKKTKQRALQVVCL